MSEEVFRTARGPRPALRVRARWIAAAVAVPVAVVLVARRVGDDKLEPTADVLHEQSRHGTWSRMFDLDGVAASFPVPLWALALVVIGLVGMPYAWVSARWLPDRGYALARVVGLLLVTWVAWWISSLRLLPFSRGSIVVSVVVVGLGAVAIGAHHRQEMRDWLGANRRVIVTAEGVFWSLFLAALFVRWSNPDLWHAARGGEKSMDFAYLNAVVKSTSFPPFDPWFAGGQMNYYYYGFVQVAALAKITAIPPAIAYNLAIATLAALLGSAAFSAGLGLASTRSLAPRRPLLIAAAAAIFATVLGNLGELHVIRSELTGRVSPEWWFWNPTRVIHPGEGEPGPISEFPAFTFIFGDLHAHAMALPVAALVLALVVGVVRGAPASVRALIPALAVLAIGLGTLSVTNTWDLPTYGLLACLGLAIAILGQGLSTRRALELVGVMAALAVGAYLAFLPFRLHYWSVFDGVQRWEGRQTRLFDYLTIHGLFLFAIASALVLQVARGADLGSVARTLRLLARRPTGLRKTLGRHRAFVEPGQSRAVALLAAAAVVVVTAGCAVRAQWPAAVAVPVVALAALAWPVRARPAVSVRDRSVRRLLLVVAVLGLVLTLAVEYYVLRNIDIGRVNTVFKLYLQVWVLFAVAAAVSAGMVLARLRGVNRRLAVTWRVAFLALVAVAALYPYLAARAKIDDRFDRSVGRTLDGSAFMEKAMFNDQGIDMRLAYDRDAIRWMLQNVEGSPVVAEINTAPTLYGWESRYAMFTGNPTIVGWDFHQRQQRPPMAPEVQERVADVHRLYRTRSASVAHDILTAYGASYVVDGPLERAYFPEGAAKWAHGSGRYWTLEYSNPGVRIYRVLTTAASESDASDNS
jgi:YYY domain-containing protein